MFCSLLKSTFICNSASIGLLIILYILKKCTYKIFHLVVYLYFVFMIDCATKTLSIHNFTGLEREN